MKNDQIFELMNAIPPDLIEEADVQAPAKRRVSRALRTGLIAACLCLALLGTSFAVAEITNMRINWGDSGISIDGYSVEYTVDFYPVDAFSQEVADLAALNPGGHITYAPGGEAPVWPHKYFNTWNEAEDFIGLDLVSNPVLDRAEPGPTGTSPWESHQKHPDPDKTHIDMNPGSTDDGELRNIYIGGSYLINGVWVRVTEMAYTERAEGDLYYAKEGAGGQLTGDGSHPRYGFVYGENCDSSAEDYTTPNGLTATVVKTTYPDKEVIYNAYFLIKGVAFNVTAGGDGPNDELPMPEPDHTREVFTAVLDGFILD